ncbi:MAG: hypothetical protein OEM63_03445 [Gammaproteobacteria bacterium]|nr:hypothetical protein [Gammaproteobacteria bacterium]
MRSWRFVRTQWLAVLTCFVAALYSYGIHAAGQDEYTIKIRAQNRDTSDTTNFCGVGIGSKGDRLDVDVTVAADGSAVGTARFETAGGMVTLMNIDRVFTFFGGLALQDSATFNTVPIWFGNTEFSSGNLAPAHVNVEIPRGCSNTKSTFTIGSDKVTVQIHIN